MRIRVVETALVGSMVLAMVLGAATAVAQQPLPGPGNDEAEQSWAQRHVGAVGGRSDADRTARLVEAWEVAHQSRPEDLEITWKLLRALFFHGEHSLVERQAKLAVFERGREVAARGFAVIARSIGRKSLDDLEGLDRVRAVKPVPQAAALHFWAAVSWGLWGEATGKLSAARQGVAEKIRDFALVAAELDPEFENGGGDRLLGRLHAEAPKIPFFTGWISRKEAIARLRAALQRAPDDPYNRFYLGEALLDHDPDATAEGRRLVASVLALASRPDHQVEDDRVRELARARLEQ